ncbi:hypothetical protein [Pedobacter sp. NJ-S-72]
MIASINAVTRKFKLSCCTLRIGFSNREAEFVLFSGEHPKTKMLVIIIEV